MHIQQARTYKIENITPPPQNFNAGLLKTGQTYSRSWGDDAMYQKGIGPLLAVLVCHLADDGGFVWFVRRWPEA